MAITPALETSATITLSSPAQPPTQPQATASGKEITLHNSMDIDTGALAQGVVTAITCAIGSTDKEELVDFDKGDGRVGSTNPGGQV
jgi:hypothetical protein